MNLDLLWSIDQLLSDLNIDRSTVQLLSCDLCHGVFSISCPLFKITLACDHSEGDHYSVSIDQH